MIESEEVPLGHLLTLVTGQLFCTSGQMGMTSLIQYLTQFPVVGEAIPQVWPVCRHGIIRQHSWLLRVVPPYSAMAQEDWIARWAWLDGREQAWGRMHKVDPLIEDDWNQHGYRRGPQAVGSDGEPLRYRFRDGLGGWTIV